jgi:nucleotide-binding universal stress UspA family protein
MAAGFITRYSVLPGKRPEFLKLLAESKTYAESRGAVSRVRSHLTGERAGQISLQTLFPSTAARAAYLDKARADGGNSPIVREMNGTNPPAVMEGRTWIQSVDPAAPIPPERNVLVSTTYAITPGRQADATALFAEADARHRALGVDFTRWTVVVSGTASGQTIRSAGYDTYAALDEFTQRNAAAQPQPGPLAPQRSHGIVTQVASAITTTLAV